MANNKVVFGNETIMDITDSTVTPETLKQGEIAYNSAGQRIVGTLVMMGHQILDKLGNVMTQRNKLQFASGYVEDDSSNGKTVYIEMIRISQANYDTLKANGQLKPGAKYFIYDAQPVAVNASNLLYSSTQSTKDKIDEVNAKGLVFRSLLTATAISTTLDTYNTYGGRKFSDYDMLAFIVSSDVYSNDIRNTQVLPRVSFAESGKRIIIQIIHGSVSGSAADYSVSAVEVDYNSDTSIKAIASGRALVNILQIVGIKFE